MSHGSAITAWLRHAAGWQGAKRAHKDVDEEGQGDVLQAQQLAGHRDQQERDREEDEKLQCTAAYTQSVTWHTHRMYSADGK